MHHAQIIDSRGCCKEPFWKCSWGQHTLTVHFRHVTVLWRTFLRCSLQHHALIIWHRSLPVPWRTLWELQSCSQPHRLPPCCDFTSLWFLNFNKPDGSVNCSIQNHRPEQRTTAEPCQNRGLSVCVCVCGTTCINHNQDVERERSHAMFPRGRREGGRMA